MSVIKFGIAALLLAGLSGTAQAQTQTQTQRNAGRVGMRPIGGVSTNYGFVHGGYASYGQPASFAGYSGFGVYGYPYGYPSGTYAVGTSAVGTYAVGSPAVGTDAIGTSAVGSDAVGTPAFGSYGAFGPYGVFSYFYAP